MASLSFAEKLRLDKSINKKLMQVGDAEEIDWNELVRRQLMPTGRGEADESVSTHALNKSGRPRSTVGDRSRLSSKSRKPKEATSNQQLSAELLSHKSRLLVLDQIIDGRKHELATDNFRFFEENSEKQLEEIHNEIGGRSDWTVVDLDHQIEIAELTAERCKCSQIFTSEQKTT